jgi:hypothetical protein
LQHIIIVGQSRSGSTLLTRLTNDGNRSVIINDAYIVQRADELAGSGPVDTRTLVKDWLNIILARSEVDSPPSLHRPICLTSRQIAEIQHEADEAQRGWTQWPEVVTGVLNIVANKIGARAIGWNTPPDYVHTERLLQLFPDCRIIYLIRDPFAVMLSYKYLPDYWGSERNRYNPLVQPLVWRQVVRQYKAAAARFPGRIRLVRYEDLVRDPAGVMAELASFTGVAFLPPDLGALERNGSNTGGCDRGLNRIEHWLASAITAGARGDFGYGDCAVPLLPRTGLGEIASSFAKSASFYAVRLVRSRDIRKRVSRFTRMLVTGR